MMNNSVSVARLSSWLSSLNGWKRIWLVFCVCVFGYYLIVWPFSSTSNLRSGYADYQRNVIKDVESGKCSVYISQSFTTLPVPSYPGSADVGGLITGTKDEVTCYYVYNYRKYNTNGNTFSIDEMNRYYSAQRSGAYWLGLGVGALTALAICVFIYAVGVTIAWVIRGFRQQKQ